MNSAYIEDRIPNSLASMEDGVLRWFLSLVMAANDIALSAKKIRETHEDFEQLYYFRLGFSHLREIAKVVGLSSERPEVRSFLASLPKDIADEYDVIICVLGDYTDRGLTKNALKDVRDELFHYPDTAGEYWDGIEATIKNQADLKVKYLEESKNYINTRRYYFTDCLISERTNADLNIEIVNKSSAVAVNIMSFVDKVLEDDSRIEVQVKKSKNIRVGSVVKASNPAYAKPVESR